MGAKSTSAVTEDGSMDGYRAAAALLVDRDATRDELRRAFRARAKQLHPDAGPHGSEADFIQLREAFDLLMATAADPASAIPEPAAVPVAPLQRSPFDTASARPRFAAVDVTDAPRQRRHRSSDVRRVDPEHQARGRQFAEHLAAAQADELRRTVAGV